MIIICAFCVIFICVFVNIIVCNNNVLSLLIFCACVDRLAR